MIIPWRAYLRWLFAGFFKNGVYYLFFLFMFYLTGNKHLSYWSWMLICPLTYHIWKFIEKHDFMKWLGNGYGRKQ